MFQQRRWNVPAIDGDVDAETVDLKCLLNLEAAGRFVHPRRDRESVAGEVVTDQTRECGIPGLLAREARRGKDSARHSEAVEGVELRRQIEPGAQRSVD